MYNTASIYQAIVTKFLGPTNSHGSRIKASASAGSITIPWNHGLNPDANHARAARALAERYGWKGDWYCGGMPDRTGSSYVFVQVDCDCAPAFVPHAIAATDA